MILHRFIGFVFFIILASFACAQQVHFVYLQTENGQPFYIKFDNKVTSSSSAGYLILPKLPDGDFDLIVGFPKKEFPEENFKISVDKGNEGFLLKNFNEKGWGLFNMQTYAVAMGNSLGNKIASKDLQDDPFSKMLANVVKDSSILEKKATVNEPATSAIIKDTKAVKDPLLTKDTLVAEDTVLIVNDTLTVAIQRPEPVIVSAITRTLFNKNIDGVEMIYLDKAESYIDTIRVFIPAGNLDDKKDTENISMQKNDIVDISPVAEIASSDSFRLTDELAKDSNQKIADVGVKELPVAIEDTSSSKPKPGNDQPIVTVQPNEPANVIDISDNKETKKQNNSADDHPRVINATNINSDCTEFASNDDFIKLRKKMAGEKTNANMIEAARKIFRSKCFSTEQIKNLSLLLPNDEGKYQFFDAAYPFTSDSNLYQTLLSQLHDPYYVNRFKAMIHK